MGDEDLVRAVVALPVAVLWPIGLPGRLDRRPHAVLAVATAALLCAPLLDRVAGWAVLATAAAVAALLPRPMTALDRAGQTRAARAGGAAPLVPLALAALVTAALAALLVDPGRAADGVGAALGEQDVAVVAAGALTALFIAGAVLGALLRPLADRITDAGVTPPGLARAGLYIGWLERGLVFTFLVTGQPEAAALALTAKSVARFPAFSSGSEALAEYVLIGTLASFVLVTLAAIATRALLGLPAL